MHTLKAKKLQLPDIPSDVCVCVFGLLQHSQANEVASSEMRQLHKTVHNSHGPEVGVLKKS